MELDDLSDDDRPNGNGAQHHRSTTARGYDDDELELLDDSATKIEEEEDEREKETEIQQLMRYWMDERMAPELLRSKEDLVNRILERLDAQVRSRLTSSFRQPRLREGLVADARACSLLNCLVWIVS